MSVDTATVLTEPRFRVRSTTKPAVAFYDDASIATPGRRTVWHGTATTREAEGSAEFSVRTAAAPEQFSSGVHRAFGTAAALAIISLVASIFGLVLGAYMLGMIGGLALLGAAIAAYVWMDRAERDRRQGLVGLARSSPSSRGNRIQVPTIWARVVRGS